MKKDTEELILSEIIKINTELIKTNSKLGYIEQDLKDFKENTTERFDALEKRFDKRFNIIEEKLNWTMEQSGEYISNHETRIQVLEAKA